MKNFFNFFLNRNESKDNKIKDNKIFNKIKDKIKM